MSNDAATASGVRKGLSSSPMDAFINVRSSGRSSGTARRRVRLTGVSV
jgi:hypothetical protein